MKKEFFKLGKVLGAVVAFCATVASAVACGLVWIPPSSHFDGVNQRGMVSLWEEVDAVDLGGGLKLPLMVHFRSDQNRISPYGGGGWVLVLLESSVYQIDERNFLMFQPDGSSRYFSRKNATETMLNGGDWKAEIKGEYINAWAECGWKLTFRKGKLVTLFTPDNRRLDFNLTGDRVTEITENGRVHLKAIVDFSTGRVTGLEFNSRRIGFSLENRPIVEMLNGTGVITRMEPSLRQVTGTPRTSKEYTFTVNKQTQPTLKVSNAGASLGATKGSPSGDRLFTWDPLTRTIVADNDWRYTIQPARNIFNNAAIKRTNASGGSESWFENRREGVETEERLDGSKRVTYTIVRGPLAGKLRREEETVNGKTRVLREHSYNELGKLAREIDADGVATEFTYDQRQRLVEIIRDGKLFGRRNYDDKDRLVEEEIVGGDKTTYNYQSNGSYEKTVREANGQVSTRTYSKNNELQSSVSPSGAKNTYKKGKYVPPPVPETTELREAKAKELTEKLAQSKDAIERCQWLLQLGNIHIIRKFGPRDPRAAIKIYETILQDPEMDICSKAQAHTQIIGAYLNLGRSEWPTAKKQAEAILAMNGDSLSEDRQKQLRKEQIHAFGLLLSFISTNQPQTDEKLWREAFEKYGSPEDFKKVLGKNLEHQKRTMRTNYFNNYPTLWN